MKVISAITLSLLLLFLITPGTVAAKWVSHEKMITKYDGTPDCTRCHKETAKDVAESLHYQMAGEAPYLDGWPKGKLAGMMDTY